MEVRGEEDNRRGHIVGANRRRGPAAPEKSARIKAFYWLLPICIETTDTSSVGSSLGQ